MDHLHSCPDGGRGREEDMAKAAFIVIRVSDATRGKMGMLDYF